MSPEQSVAEAVQLHHAGDLRAAAALYRRALDARPDHPGALNGLGMIAFQAGRHDTAIGLLERVVAVAGEHAGYLMNLGAVHDAAGNPDAAAGCYRRAIAAAPAYPDPYWNLGALLLRRGEAGAAVDVFDRCLAAVGRDWHALAYKAHALRDAGRETESDWLLDHVRLVRRDRFDAPAGYTSAAAFNAALAEQVSRHPSLRANVLSTVNGRHTGELLRPAEGALADLEPVIDAAVRGYLAALPDDPAHPVVRWAPGRWRLTGWGVVMRDGGHERSHIHPNGWISGVLYVSLPDGIDESPDHQGWLRFGAPTPELNARSEPELVDYRPEYGRITLFPSYFYHGTVPFQSDQPRICISFDVEPVYD